MDNIATINISVVGDESGQPFSGEFEVKTLLSRADRFEADRLRRAILGDRGGEAAPALAGEAFMLGQLSVRIKKAPAWWTDHDNGLSLSDLNVIVDVFNAAVAKEEERKAAMVKAADTAATSLKSKKKE